MLKLDIQEIIDRINQEKTFEAVSSDYSMTIKIDRYVPYACAAIHDGHELRKELWNKCTHTAYERWYEDDPETKNMIKSHPIVIAGRDSRFEYDLNRDPDNAVFKDAWGKALWSENLSNKEIEISKVKHDNFYKITNTLIEKLEEKFGVCVVYDMHSYNWQRWDRVVPTWNLGTHNIDSERFDDSVEEWRESLSEIMLPNNIESTAKINNTFFGNGYFLKFITNNFKNTLVLATEIAKIYCDETSGTIYPEVVRAVENELKIRLPKHAANFYKNYKKI